VHSQRAWLRLFGRIAHAELREHDPVSEIALKNSVRHADSGSMIRRQSHAARFQAFKAFHADLSRALQAEREPWAGDVAPARESYVEDASRLAFDLSRTTTRAELTWTLRRAFGRHSPFLVDRVARALDKFKAATETARRSAFSS
jgi:hypothetical protein